MKFKDTKYGDLTGQIYKGDIDVSKMDLTSLQGAPLEVTGKFRCDYNRLRSLKYCPQKVGQGFFCDSNKITTLEFGPIEVGGNFRCDNNKLKSLAFAPKKINGAFHCDVNNLTTLEGISYGTESIYCNKNPMRLSIEKQAILDNPEMLKGNFKIEMYKATKDDFYMPPAVRKIFLMKD